MFGHEYMIVHLPSGETVKDGFSSENDAYTWLENATVEPADMNQYAVELVQEDD